MGLASAAHAQVGLSANLQTEYRYRGVSLSEGRPTAALNIAFDHKSGAYAGGSLTGVATDDHGARLLGHTAYVGYARRIGANRSWDIGVSNLQVKYYGFARRTFEYNEIYTGISTEHANLRVHYSPKYFGQPVKTIYIDLAGSYRPRPNWRVYGHAGYLTPVGSRNPAGARRRYDLSAGVATTIRNCEVNVSVTRLSVNRATRTGRSLDQNALVVGASYFF